MSKIYIEVPEPFKTDIISYTKETIPTREIVEQPIPHITIKTGLHTQDAEEVAGFLGKFYPIRVMFGKTSMFIADDLCPYDVSKLDVFGMSLIKLNRKLSNLPNTTVYKTYNPHITLSYLLKYCAIQYVGHNTLIGQKWSTDHILFKNDADKISKIYNTGEIE